MMNFDQLNMRWVGWGVNISFSTEKWYHTFQVDGMFITCFKHYRCVKFEI